MRPKLIYGLLIGMMAVSCSKQIDKPIDRHALVNRHRVMLSGMDSLNSLTVGNGNFAFTVDLTGLQTFPEEYVNGVQLGTLSNWGWHSFPNTAGYTHEQTVNNFQVAGRQVGYYYDYQSERTTERARASAWLRQNPHRMNLALIGMKIYDDMGQLLDVGAIENPQQELNLWKGEIVSSFEVTGEVVNVITICHPQKDQVAVRISSKLLEEGRLHLEVLFPAADPGWKNTADGSLARHPNASHESRILDSGNNSALLEHRQDKTHYFVSLGFSKGEVLERAPHRFALVPARTEMDFSFTSEFTRADNTSDPLPAFDAVRELTHAHWENFWSTGGAVDFSACLDPRAFELERRVVLSRYLTQVQCSGTLPPQETGLTYNSWHGKHHLEMHWWHGVHFALWQKEEILEKQMEYYASIYPEAKKLAEFQGYKGVRWPKMTGPEGYNSPSTVGNYLIWQQPHYIYFAELLNRLSSDSPSTREKHKKLVYETADFMASYPEWDSIRGRYILPPPLIPAQESFAFSTTLNPAFELCYWEWALRTAISWKEGEEAPVPELWQDVVDDLAGLPVKDSLYLFTEDGSDSYTNPRYLSDHPMVLGCMGLLPSSQLVNPVIMQNTFSNVVASWNWDRTWGWDYPMVALSAGALGRSEEAIDYLLLDVQKNTYLTNGHNYQDERLTIYLPGNGGLLTAVATLCTHDQFPKNGLWEVRWENLNDF